jgi:hypothetical protein
LERLAVAEAVTAAQQQQLQQQQQQLRHLNTAYQQQPNKVRTQPLPYFLYVIKFLLEMSNRFVGQKRGGEDAIFY